jgi:hypothetical protein
MEWVWLGLATHSVAGYGLVWPWPELYMTSAAHFQGLDISCVVCGLGWPCSVLGLVWAWPELDLDCAAQGLGCHSPVFVMALAGMA